MRKRPNARKWPPRRHSFETQGSRNGKESRGTAKKVPEEQEGRGGTGRGGTGSRKQGAG